MQFVLAWFDIWKPIFTSTVRKRLSARGIPPEKLRTGRYMGVSDPDRRSFGKGGHLIEDDLGMMWLTHDALEYHGDTQDFTIPRDRLTALERSVDKGSMEAYVGASHVIIVWLDDNGQERRTRLHPGDCWTLNGSARALDRLAVLLREWQGEQASEPAEAAQ